jgi:type II secretion system protein D
MNRPSLFPLTCTVALLVTWLAAAEPLLAQNTRRPGSSARGVSRAGTSGRGLTGGGGSNANTSGPRQYRSNTLLGDATIQIDPETRSIIVVTDEDTNSEMLKVIKELDRPKPQVLIKVVFLEVTYNKGYDVGVEGGYTANLRNPINTNAGTQNTVTTNNTLDDAGRVLASTVTTNNQTIAAAAQGLGQSLGSSSSFGLAALQTAGAAGFYGRVIADDYNATIRLLATRGKVEVLSRPSIMARNNQEAVIVVGQEVPFITNSRITDLGQTINTIQYDNVGIILRVTPFITSKNMVEMIVAPEISSLTADTVAISNTVSSPIIAKRSAETVVVTPNGATAVIGGLMETQRTSNVQKIPLLGDIPVLGAAFRRTIRNDVKRELMIFLTPTIVQDPQNVGDLTGDELANTELVEKGFSPEEFQKFFNNTDTQYMPTGTVPVKEDPAPQKTRDAEARRVVTVVNPGTTTEKRTETYIKAEPTGEPVAKKVETTTVVKPPTKKTIRSPRPQ